MVKLRNSLVMCDLTVLMLSVWPSCSSAQLSIAVVLLPTHGKVCSTWFITLSGDTFRATRMAGGIIYAGGHVVSSNISWMIVLCTTWMKASSIQLYRMNLWGTLLSSSSIEVAGSVFIGTFTKAQSTYFVKALANGKARLKTCVWVRFGLWSHVYLVCQRFTL